MNALNGAVFVLLGAATILIAANIGTRRPAAGVGLLLIAMIWVIVLGSGAHAGTVSLAPVYDQVNQLEALVIQGVILAIVFWVAYVLHQLALRWPWIGRWLITPGAQAAMSANLNTALQNGAAIFLAQQKAWEDVHKDVQVQGAMQRFAAQWAIDHVPDAVNHFGLGPQELAEMALSKIPLPPSVPIDTTGATAPVSTVTVKALPPIKAD